VIPLSKDPRGWIISPTALCESSPKDKFLSEDLDNGALAINIVPRTDLKRRIRVAFSVLNFCVRIPVYS
jgi:hypothetical protein